MKIKWNINDQKARIDNQVAMIEAMDNSIINLIDHRENIKDKQMIDKMILKRDQGMHQIVAFLKCLGEIYSLLYTKNTEEAQELLKAKDYIPRAHERLDISSSKMSEKYKSYKNSKIIIAGI